MKLIRFPRIKFRDGIVKEIFEEKNSRDILEKYRIGIQRDGTLIVLVEEGLEDVVPLVLYHAYSVGFLGFLNKDYKEEDFKDTEVYDANDPRRPWGLGGLVSTKHWDKDFVYYFEKWLKLMEKIIKPKTEREFNEALTEYTKLRKEFQEKLWGTQLKK